LYSWKATKMTEQHPCNARILTTPYSIGETILYDSEECGKPTTRHVWVDDADARMYICGKCLTRWVSQKQKNTNWYGWFDCDTHKNTPAADSPFYWDTLRKQFGSLPLPELRKKFLELKIEQTQAALKVAVKPHIIPTHKRLNLLRAQLKSYS
jgi:hypothetical protein